MYLNCSMFTKTSTTAAIRTLKKEKNEIPIFSRKNCRWLFPTNPLILLYDVKLTYSLIHTWFDVEQNQMNELVILAILPANHFKMTDKIVSLFELKKTRRWCKRRGAGMCDDYDQFSWWLNVSHKVCSKREVFCGVLACHSGDFFKYNWQKLAAVFLPSFCDSKGFFKWNLGETQVEHKSLKE